MAEPEIAVQETYYPVTGANEDHIRRSLNRNSPVRHDGSIYDAYTRWDVDWHLKWAYDADGACRPAGVTTLVRIRYTLPELQNRQALAPELTARWDRYVRALVAHEQGHAAHGIDAAREIERRLPKLGEYPSCDELQAEAHALARQIIDRHILKDSRHDAVVRSGQDNTLRFP
jgi:predicted secreted Zn-dependent protease